MKIRVTDRTRPIAAKSLQVAGREGFVLPVVMFALTIMGLLAVVSLRTADNEQRSSRALRESGAALYAAEAGLQEVWATWDTSVTNALAQGDSLAPVFGALGNGATYRAVTQRVGQGLLAVRVTGRAAGPFGGQLSLTQMVNFQPMFQWAGFGRDGMSIGGGIVTGNMGTNGDLSLAGGGAIVGDATVGGTVDDPTQVSGTVTEGAPPVMFPSVECPSTAYGPTPTGSGFTFNPVTGDIDVTSSNTLTFTAGTYYFHDFRKAGGAELIIPVGQHVQIYLSGDLQMTGNGWVNQNNDASFLKIWGCGSDTVGWSVGGSATAFLTVYAPNHDLDLKGSGDKYGSFTGAMLTKQGNGNVAYDPNLQTTTDGFNVRLTRSWTQLLN